MLFFWRRSAVDRLLKGYRHFRRTTFAKQRALYKRLTLRGQHPKIMVISCADSRVSPSTVFSTSPGEIFVARNIANIVPPHQPDAAPRSIAAAVEYAVKVLKVEHIVVLGHGRCGGVAALVSHGHGLPETHYIRAWVDIAAPALDLIPNRGEGMSEAELTRASEYAVIQLSLTNLMSYPWVREAVDKRAIRLHGMHFNIFDGLLAKLDQETNEFDFVRA